MLAEAIIPLLSAPLPILEAALGRPVTRCAPARGTALSNTTLLDRARDAFSVYDLQNDLVVTAVYPRRYTQDRAQLPSPLYDEFKVGRTITQLLARGLSRKLIGRARRAGGVVMSHRSARR